jgi:hypothetical protein
VRQPYFAIHAHLCAAAASKAIEVLDLAGAPQANLREALRSSDDKLTWLVAPAYLVPRQSSGELLAPYVGLHLDTDQLGPFVQSAWSKAGMGIWSFARDSNSSMMHL